MANVAERARGDDAEACGIHYLDVPMIAQRADHPPANDIRGEKYRKHCRSEKGDERATKEDDLERGADEDSGVKQDHPAESGFFYFCGASRDHLLLMTARNLQLDDAEQSHGHEQAEKRDDAQFHCSKRNSALNPGPKAAARAYSPDLRGRFSSHSCKMKRMVALERLPTLERISQDGSVSHLQSPNSFSTLPSRRAPPGCRIHPLMSACLRPWRSRKPFTRLLIFAPIISGTSFESKM